MSKLLAPATPQLPAMTPHFLLMKAALLQPVATFERLAASPYGRVWLPIGGALLVFYLQAFALAIRQQAPLDWRFAGGVVNLCLGWPLRTLLLAALVRLLQGRPTLFPLLFLSAWATLPLTLRSVGQTLYLVVTGHPVAHPGLAGLLAGADLTLPLVKLSYFALGWIDLFTCWHLALLVVAVRTSAPMSMGKGRLIVVLYSIVIAILCALFFFALPNR